MRPCSTPAGNNVNSVIENLTASAHVSTENCFDHFENYIASLLQSLAED